MGYDDDHGALEERMEAIRVRVKANQQRFVESRSRFEATMRRSATGRSERQPLHQSALARLQARLDSLPVIEQAKGVIVAQSGCCPEEAFDILRRASQRSNVKVRDLAADIIRRAARGGRPASNTSRVLSDQSGG